MKASEYFKIRTQRCEDSNYDGAIVDYTEVIQLKPDYVYIWCNWVPVWSKKGEFSKAIVDFDKAIRLDSNNVDAFAIRGAVWKRKKAPRINLNNQHALGNYFLH